MIEDERIYLKAKKQYSKGRIFKFKCEEGDFIKIFNESINISYDMDLEEINKKNVNRYDRLNELVLYPEKYFNVKGGVDGFKHLFDYKPYIKIIGRNNPKFLYSVQNCFTYFKNKRELISKQYETSNYFFLFNGKTLS